MCGFAGIKVASKKAFFHGWDVHLFVGELIKPAIIQRELKKGLDKGTAILHT
jgi:hypothetical protein